MSPNTKGLFTLIFDTSSLLMTYSIISHLLRIAKIEKPHLIFSYFDYSNIKEYDYSTRGEKCYSDTNREDDDSDKEEEILTSSTSIFRMTTANNQYNFAFHRFKDSRIDTVIPFMSIKPEIDGSIIKIGQIICFLCAFKSEDDSRTTSFFDSSLRKNEIYLTRFDFFISHCDLFVPC